MTISDGHWPMTGTNGKWQSISAVEGLQTTEVQKTKNINESLKYRGQ